MVNAAPNSRKGERVLRNLFPSTEPGGHTDECNAHFSISPNRIRQGDPASKSKFYRTNDRLFSCVLYHAAECENRLPHSSMLNKVGCVKMKNLPVGLDRIALRFPSFEAAFEEFDLEKLQVQGSTQHGPASLISGTSAVNDCLFVLRDQARYRQHIRRGILRAPGIISE